ncbi:hypothetical protein [Raineyella sp. LH-20]|uniref:hypothetical protein n=1 Tax=Raineyella sp. LH-20 TaxID=3081204 RepID=UPI002953E45D|nr:hypothetical protein [Raineyella sp. LH-20]WOP17400.1 hypothetical protein R0146_08905 [Raineyella sp. LH-20]
MTTDDDSARAEPTPIKRKRGNPYGWQRSGYYRPPRGGGPGGPAKGAGTGGPARAADALQHGATSTAVVSPVADALAADLVARRPDLAPHREAVAAWAAAEARCILLRHHEDRVGLLDEDGSPRGYTSLLVTAERAAERARQRLGLDPLSEAELAKARATASLSAVDLSLVLEAGREALEGTAVPATIEAAPTRGIEVDPEALEEIAAEALERRRAELAEQYGTTDHDNEEALDDDDD